MNYKIIEVEWEDITFFSGTHEVNDNFQNQHLKSIGYLVKEDKYYLILALSLEITEPFRIQDCLKIPKKNIIKRRLIK